VGVGHYENFPVASLLCPPQLRPPIVAIYHFARTADDLADEGDDPPAARLAALAEYRSELHACFAGRPPAARWQAVFSALAMQQRVHALPLQPLEDLLDAFKQDVGNPRYADRAALLAYCARSANPIGRLLMHLYGVDDARSLARSDAICSALQLINFWQDLSVDLPRGRHYVPLSDAAAHGLDPTDLSLQTDTPATQALLRSLRIWARDLLLEGAPLALRLPGRAGWELRLVVQGGLAVLEKIAGMDECVLRRRPRLVAADLPRLLWRAMRMRGASQVSAAAGAAR